MSNVFRRDFDFYREGDDVIVYPVEAARVEAFLSRGGAGVPCRGTFIEDDVLAQTDNGAEVQVPEITFETTKARADAAGIAKDRSSIEYDGRVFTVLMRRAEDPGFVLVHLRADGY